MSHVCFTSVCFLLLFLTYLRPSVLPWIVSPVSHSTLSLVYSCLSPLLCQTDCLFSSCQSFVLLFRFRLCLTCPLDSVYLGFCTSQIDACFPFISPESMSCFRSCLQCYHDRFTALWKTAWANSLKNNIHLKLLHNIAKYLKCQDTESGDPEFSVSYAAIGLGCQELPVIHRLFLLHFLQTLCVYTLLWI